MCVGVWKMVCTCMYMCVRERQQHRDRARVRRDTAREIERDKTKREIQRENEGDRWTERVME